MRKLLHEQVAEAVSLHIPAVALFPQDPFDQAPQPACPRPMLFALTFFPALCLGRRKFGFQARPRPAPPAVPPPPL